jgi:hypothetical protein
MSDQTMSADEFRKIAGKLNLRRRGLTLKSQATSPKERPIPKSQWSPIKRTYPCGNAHVIVDSEDVIP